MSKTSSEIAAEMVTALIEKGMIFPETDTRVSTEKYAKDVASAYGIIHDAVTAKAG